MTTVGRFWHDAKKPNHPLFCGQCAFARPPFKYGNQLVGLELVTSVHKFIALPDGTKQAFEQGQVECSKCGQVYFPDSAWDPAE